MIGLAKKTSAVGGPGAADRRRDRKDEPMNLVIDQATQLRSLMRQHAQPAAAAATAAAAQPGAGAGAAATHAAPARPPLPRPPKRTRTPPV